MNWFASVAYGMVRKGPQGGRSEVLQGKGHKLNIAVLVQAGFDPGEERLITMGVPTG